MGLVNHLKYWGNVIIPSCGIIAGYFYFANSEYFTPNPIPKVTEAGFFPINHSATIVWLMVMVPFSFNGLFLYISKPWKVRIYRNYPLFIVVLLNIIASITLFYLTPFITTNFFTVELNATGVSISLAIVGVSVGLSYLFNQIVDQMERHEDDDE